ncbi:MAG: hypothetical protein KBS54_07585, partial [Synergistaceae bacterium]|nr:hypothetical protein [Candidatus Equadaptatus faecalis]
MNNLKKVKKSAAALMLLSFIFGTVSPAIASPFLSWSGFHNDKNVLRTVRLNGTFWTKAPAGGLLEASYSCPMPGARTWAQANGDANNYKNNSVKDSWEKAIVSSSRLMTKGEYDAFTNQLGGTGKFTSYTEWWLSTYIQYQRYYIVREGGATYSGHALKPYSRRARPYLVLNGTNVNNNVWFLSPYNEGNGAKGLVGAITTAAANTTQYKITYKDTSLAAPVIGGGALTLDAAGTSEWYTATGDRVSATVGNADPLAAPGYMLMKWVSTANTLTLGGAGSYTGDADLYLHHEIYGTNYDRMSAASTDLKSLGLKFTYANGKLVAMTLPELYGTAENAITLNNGFELTLSGDSYAQDITAASGGGTLIS